MDYNPKDSKTAAFRQFKGIWAAVTTPFRKDLSLDEEGLIDNIKYLTDYLNIDGIFCNGVMGEFWALTLEERKTVAELVVSESKGKCRVIVHTGSHAANDTVILNDHAAKIGADYVIMMGPYFPFCTDQMRLNWLEYINERSNIGIWLFDTPYSGNDPISPNTMDKIADLEKICGAKLAHSLEHYIAVNNLCKDRLVLSSPSEKDFLMMIEDYGQQVHQSSASPYLFQTATSKPMNKYAKLAFDGNFKNAKLISKEMDAIRLVGKNWLHGSWLKDGILPIAAIKFWSELLGMAAGPTRTPFLNLDLQKKRYLEEDLRSVGLLQ